MNVALLSVDAFAAEHAGLLGYDRETTPRLTELATDGALWSTCIAQSSHTRESVPSLFYSAYPFELGAVGPVPDDKPMLSTVLADAGYETGGFHSNPYLSRAYNFDRGFGTFDDSLSLANNRIAAFLHRVVNHFRTRPYTRADDLNEMGMSWVDARDSSEWFLWLHYMDPHGPYQPPREFQEPFGGSYVEPKAAKRLWRRTVDEPQSITPEERATLVDLYDAEIRFTDAMIGSFVDGLRERNLLEETLVVIAADHGDAFGQHGYYGHPRALHEELIHVPLIVRWPDGPAGVQIDRPVENIDIAPTILDAVNVSTPDDFAGTSLRSTVSSDNGGDPVAFSQAHSESDASRYVAVRTSQYKYHATVTGDDEVRPTALYDLSEDPTETEDLLDMRTDGRARMHDLLSIHLDEMTATPTQMNGESISETVEDRLQDLGYR